jgi:diaminohydroxyphosphoribosylaminopyrimidine deaminase/5-amino-6-(5-phosphoribosylamino)uracil reductase
MTLDGKIAATTGHSAWITSPAARAEVHQVRSTCEAVIVGGNTVRRDNPLLTSRMDLTPLRVVLSRSLDLPKSAQLWDTTQTPTLVVTETNTQPETQAFLRQQGVEVLELDDLTPAAVMTYLYDRGFLTVLWECGGKLAASAIADGSVQKVLAFIAPKIIGGRSAPSPVDDLGLAAMTDALLLERVHWRSIGSDLLVEGYLRQNDRC